MKMGRGDLVEKFNDKIATTEHKVKCRILPSMGPHAVAQVGHP